MLMELSHCESRLVYQLSRAKCIVNETFGCEDDGEIERVWVADGCRGTFKLTSKLRSCGYMRSTLPAKTRVLCPPNTPQPSRDPLFFPAGSHQVSFAPAESAAGSQLLQKGQPSMRIALELTGCLRSLNHTMHVRLAAVRALKSAGFHPVDLYCAIEACEGEGTAKDIIEDLAARFRAESGPSSTVNCAWWPLGNGIIGSSDQDIVLRRNANKRPQLKQEYQRWHPQYPYSFRNQETSVDNTLSQWHKFAVARILRKRQPVTYDVVWRMRPDYYTLGGNWRRVVALCERQRASGKTGRGWYIIPSMDPTKPRLGVGLGFQDVEAMLSETAADVFADMWYAMPHLYANGTHFHPETMLHKHLETQATTSAHMGSDLQGLPDTTMVLVHCPGREWRLQNAVSRHYPCWPWGLYGSINHTSLLEYVTQVDRAAETIDRSDLASMVFADGYASQQKSRWHA